MGLLLVSKVSPGNIWPMYRPNELVAPRAELSTRAKKEAKTNHAHDDDAHTRTHHKTTTNDKSEEKIFYWKIAKVFP